ncbi:hypothetical protein [Anaeromyxobacter diazotrophicus]|uniref:Uncharacterized protein n=1 Tax=Anaeromyxobacter diazotrophicus TaxID=2590199 RepID=A0A7I9VSI9_9BACT|nr:hypothetical protein [Anaeromyxobacter diazotrophicus]GEJ59049.1 hypothetical protein AMYX_37900 [Anaeromyxobacter diazotrophicus]
MSDAPIRQPPSPEEQAHGFAHPPAEEDFVPSKRIVLVGAAALIVFSVGALAAGLGMRTLRRELNPDGPAPRPAAAGQAKIGMVEQRLFEHSNQGPAWRAQAQRRLESTGWVDRQKGLVHIPIDRAMDRVVKGEHP